MREHRFSRHSNSHGSSVTSFAAYEAQGGSRDPGDLETSNLFVAHLPDTVTEDKFGEYFGQFGEITSIKIMWPRGDAREVLGNDMSSRRAKTSGLSGFVSFKRRKDAEVALRELDGASWGGSILRVGWSKAVATSGRVLYGRRNSRSRSPDPRRSHRHQRSYSRSRSRSRSPAYERRKRRDSTRSRERHSHDDHSHRRSRSRSYDRSHRRERRRRSRESHRVPRDEQTFIELVAVMTRAHGKTFEDSLMERERGNPQYEFLYSHKSPAGRLYEDLLDPEYSAPEGFDDDGNDAAYSTDNEEMKEAETISRSKLGPLARKRFKAMLRAMAGKRGEVARCMAFCLEHGEAAAEVSNIIISSLLITSTAVPRKIARLHLVSDIVHNSAVPLPSAWKYRQELQQRLGLVFDHLSTIYHSFTGRMTAETFKRQVVAVVDVWDDRIVFPPDQTQIWRERLDGKEVVKAPVMEEVEQVVIQEAPAVSKFKLAFKPIMDPEGEEDMEIDDDEEATPVEPVSTEKTMQHEEEEDLDGAPMIDEDVDGDVLEEDIDGAPLDDVDGAPLQDDMMDGEPVDLDGEPI
ncbi:hypothetical protein M408DRAFT_253799 [Serendipita vermifera MAFF 305830]|uniref:CID domain-containing protein n=1 Tax=Serendipita vermifera MAFF 305830 TaxID=933852 RepID=A0A0C3BI22_SERVB|nr:hypothetical protein M408DRAFT_253799 [Serendipita vermifera MAFF 305830]